jgi:hypothetical protein
MAGIELEVSPAQEHLESLATQLVETQHALLSLSGVLDYFRERCEKLEHKLEGLHVHRGGEERGAGGTEPILQEAGATETEEEKEVH